MGIRFNLKQTTGKHSTIRAIIRIRGVKYTLATGIKVEVKDWDKKREQCNSNLEANEELARARRQIRRSIEKTGKPPTEIKKKWSEIGRAHV